jgi:CRP-like cAMP-binding protein
LRRSDAISAARSSSWFSRQSTVFQETLCAKARLLSFDRSEHVFIMGDQADDFFFLAEGIVLTSAAHPIVGEVQGQVIHPGQWFGEAAALGQRKRLASIVVRRPCQVVAFPVSAAHEAMQAEPAFAFALLDLMANGAEEHMLHGIDLLIHDPKLRLCSRLLTFAGRRLDQLPPQSVSIPLSQDELALTSCLSRQSVNRILGELVQSGICELHYGEVRIVDTTMLVEIVNGAVSG